jgi:uncharacterized tellurite resistance protein B-like protein
MLSRIVELFSSSGQPEDKETHEERVRIATCVLMLEAAGADNEFSPLECSQIVDLLQRRFDLSQEDAEELMSTSVRRQAESYDLWKFTNTINQHCGLDEKLEILVEIWRIIYADEVLDGHEDYLAHKLGRLLNVTHPQLMRAKMAARSERLRGT